MNNPDAAPRPVAVQLPAPREPHQAGPAGAVDLPWRDARLLALGAALLTAMSALSRLSGQVLDATGRAWPFAGLMGPSRLTDHRVDGWLADVSGSFTPGAGDPLSRWMLLYLALDLAFVVVYTHLLHRLLRRRQPTVLPWLYLLALADLLEDALASGWAMTRHTATGSLEHTLFGFFAQALVWASFAKWLLALVLAGLVLRRLIRPEVRRRWRGALGRTVTALYIQRFSVLAVLPVAALSVVPGSGILDQLPDVERRWLDTGRNTGHGLAAVGALTLLALVVFLLGRIRSDWVWRRRHGVMVNERTGHLWSVWLFAPVVLGGLAVIVELTGGDVAFDRLAAFCAIPLLVVGLSALLSALVLTGEPEPGESRWRGFRRWLTAQAVAPAIPRFDRSLAEAVIRAGDVIAALTVCLAGLGLVRSFSAPLVLALTPQGSAQDWTGPAAMLLAGLVVAVAPWAVLAGLLKAVAGRTALVTGLDPTTREQRRGLTRRLDQLASLVTPGSPAPEPDGTQRGNPRLRWILLVTSASTFLLIGCLPAFMAEYAGVIACLNLALASFTVLIGVLVAFAQEGPPPQLLRVAGLRTTPIVTLLAATVAFASFATGDATVHGVQAGPPIVYTTDPRPDLRTAFRSWLDASAGCDHTFQLPLQDAPGTGADNRVSLPSGRTVSARPMLMVAAEGGGIRAAYWSSATVARIARTGPATRPGSTTASPCGARATLFSTGVSGGAVGMAVSRYSSDPVRQVKELAGAQALGVGSIGLFVRDLLDSATGVSLPVLGSPEVVREYDGRPAERIDRAGLMEAVWQRHAPALSNPFLPATAPADAAHWPMSGHLVLGSTSVSTGCRVLVSQLRLPTTMSGPTTGTESRCDTTGSPAPFSIDLLHDYGPILDGRTRRPEDRCLGDLRASTAAMLSARFPYVTPSGVVGPCAPWRGQQLVDGAYTENSGLGTIVDLADSWLPLVQAHNEEVLAAAPADAAGPLVVPVVVWVQDGNGADIAPAAEQATSELFVPLIARQHAATAQKEPAALLHRLSDLLGEGSLCGPQQRATADGQALATACAQASLWVGDWAPHRVAVVHQTTQPAVTAPLGWVLSGASMDGMDRALRQQAEDGCPPGDRDLVCVRGYGSLKDVLDLWPPG